MLCGDAKKNSVATGRIDDARTLSERFSVDDLKKVPHKTSNNCGSEELPNFAASFQIVCLGCWRKRHRNVRVQNKVAVRANSVRHEGKRPECYQIIVRQTLRRDFARLTNK